MKFHSYHIKVRGDLESFILFKDAPDSLLMSWPHSPVCQWWAFRLGIMGSWVGERRTLSLWRPADVTLKADIQLTFLNHPGLISSCQDYFSNPSAGPPPSRLWLLLTALVRYTFLKSCVYPIKGPWGFLLPVELSASSSVWHLGSFRN